MRMLQVTCLTAALSAAVIAVLAFSGASVTQTELNAQLRQATCTQNWRQAIQILDQMKRVAGSESGSQLTSYRKQLEGLARKDVALPSWQAAEIHAKLCPIDFLQKSGKG